MQIDIEARILASRYPDTLKNDYYGELHNWLCEEIDKDIEAISEGGLESILSFLLSRGVKKSTIEDLLEVVNNRQ